MRISLSVYGATFGMGIDPRAGRPTITPSQFMDKAISVGLEGVELPVSLMQGEDATAVARYAHERGLFITLETEGYDPGKLAGAIDLGVRLGAGTLRTMVGGAKLGGDRRPLSGRWQLPCRLKNLCAGLWEHSVILTSSSITPGEIWELVPLARTPTTRWISIQMTSAP